MSDIGMRIYFEHGEYEVWVGPADDLKGDNIINAFIAGLGETRDQAVANAVRELEALVEQLQAPTGHTHTDRALFDALETAKGARRELLVLDQSKV